MVAEQSNRIRAPKSLVVSAILFPAVLAGSDTEAVAKVAVRPEQSNNIDLTDKGLTDQEKGDSPQLVQEEPSERPVVRYGGEGDVASVAYPETIAAIAESWEFMAEAKSTAIAAHIEMTDELKRTPGQDQAIIRPWQMLNSDTLDESQAVFDDVIKDHNALATFGDQNLAQKIWKRRNLPT